ncbi:MAG: alpha/beta fold hydrolase [Actinomycetota bacterium]
MERNGWIAFAAAAAGVAAGAIAERMVVGRERERPDPERNEAFGSLPTRTIGPVRSFDGTMLNLEEAGRGPTIVMSHGYSLQNRIWHYQIRDLSDRYRLVMFDQRGHGLSEPARNGDWSLEALARDLTCVIDRSESERVVVLGHSMGGISALKAFELFPEMMNKRLAGLVLVDTTAADVLPGIIGRLPDPVVVKIRELGEKATHAILSLDRAKLQRLRDRTTDLGWLITRLTGFGANPSPAQVKFLEKMLTECSIDTWIELVPAVTGVDVTAALPNIKVPTLVIVGTHDRLTPLAQSERLASEIPGAQLATIAGAGHTSMLESPRSFNARLRVFLDSLDGKGLESLEPHPMEAM